MYSYWIFLFHIFFPHFLECAVCNNINVIVSTKNKMYLNHLYSFFLSLSQLRFSQLGAEQQEEKYVYSTHFIIINKYTEWNEQFQIGWNGLYLPVPVTIIIFLLFFGRSSASNRNKHWRIDESAHTYTHTHTSFLSSYSREFYADALQGHYTFLFALKWWYCIRFDCFELPSLAGKC